MRSPTTRLKRTLLPALVLSSLAALLAAPLMSGRREAPPAPAARAEAPDARETYGRIPLSFEANRGQTDASVDFLARGAGYTLFLRPTEAVFVLQNAESEPTDEGRVTERSIDAKAQTPAAEARPAARARRFCA